MEFRTDNKDHADEISALFAATFTASEGAEEGALVGALARDMMEATNADDLIVVTAQENDALSGCIMFSRLTFENDDRTAFILAPVAVATGRQGLGVGQALLRYGLDVLRERNVDVVVTYGDPNYYSKVGFAQVTVDDVPAPFALNQPEGWQAQSLTDQLLTPLKGPSRCVPALNDPKYW
ncbi:GNAT family N-acetyltransferase [Silicimonas sp. MF1-12-2]|uniref:GNAT family N-acetyltransferase n=1 Tax=Silicimonas sp. MF1-12-2 TaxID=3384793 RepID=UPI0039B496B6